MVTWKTKVSSIESKLENTDTEPETYLPLQYNLKPLIKSLQFFGLYIPKNIYNADSMDDSKKRLGFGKLGLQFFKVYAYVWLIISTFWLLRYIPSFWVGIDYKPGFTTIRIVQLSWMIQCYTNTIFILRASTSPDRLPAFYQHFNTILTDGCSNCIKMKPNCINVRTRVRVATSIAWIFFASNVTIITFYTNRGLNVTVSDPFSSDVSYYVFLCIGVWEVGAWIFPIVFNVGILNIVRFQFKSFAALLEKSMKENPNLVLTNIRQMRLKHVQLCKCVTILEKDIKYVIASVYVTTLFIACFIVFQMVTTSELNTIEYVIYSGWLAQNIGLLLAISIAAALVNEEVICFLIRCFLLIPLSIGDIATCQV